jgi:hypothetical protein
VADVNQGLLSDILHYAKAEIGEFNKLREHVGTVLAILVVLSLAIIFYLVEVGRTGEEARGHRVVCGTK